MADVDDRDIASAERGSAGNANPGGGGGHDPGGRGVGSDWPEPDANEDDQPADGEM